jgi:hypothetical protein
MQRLDLTLAVPGILGEFVEHIEKYTALFLMDSSHTDIAGGVPIARPGASAEVGFLA